MHELHLVNDINEVNEPAPPARRIGGVSLERLMAVLKASATA
jgi:hypothetical protein